MKNKIIVKMHDAFPHEYDELAKNLNHTIEDNLKLHVELKDPDSENPNEKWEKYQNIVVWVCFCDKMGIRITDRKEVFEIMKKLWTDVRNSPIYKGGHKGR